MQEPPVSQADKDIAVLHYGLVLDGNRRKVRDCRHAMYELPSVLGISAKAGAPYSGDQSLCSVFTGYDAGQTVGTTFANALIEAEALNSPLKKGLLLMVATAMDTPLKLCCR